MKEYTYNGVKYKRDNNGQWQFFSPTYNKWVYTYYNMPSIDGKQVYDSDFLEKAFKNKDSFLKEAVAPVSSASPEAYKKKRDEVMANPLMTTQQKIKYAQGSPLVDTPEVLKTLNKTLAIEKAQKKKEDELKANEQARQNHLKNVGSDNTRVNINTDAFPKIPTMDETFQQWDNITRRQKEEAERIVHNGDLAKHFPNLRDQYLSEENSHRPGGPLSMEELALEQIRTNPDFFKTLEERKYKDFQKREQESWDEMPWYMKGINTINALASDPITTLERGLLEFERPLAFQGLESTDPESFGEDARFYDKMLNRDENVLNNTLNYINPFRAASSAGQNLQQGDYGDAAIDVASIIPMIKGAKAGWKGMNALMKVNPTKIASYANSNLISNASPLVQSISNKATVGNLLTGYGGYHAATENFPNAFNAYREGDWKTGNKELFMGALNTTPLALEARSSKIIPRTVQGVKGAYNDVATGDSFMNNYVNAWKSPASGLSSEQSAAMFDQVLNSAEFTNAEKALVREYQYSSFPFTKAGTKQDDFNALIQKASAKFPENAVVTRKFYGENPQGAFQNVKGEPGKYTEFSIQDRPSAFSVGKGSDASWGKDRVVMGGKNLKKVEGNFVKNAYEPVPNDYYANLPEESLTVRPRDKGLENDSGWSFGETVGDNYYGTARLTPEELNAQAEILYNRRVADFSNPENSRFMQPGKVDDFAGKSKDGSGTNVYTQEEAEAIIAEQTAKYNQRQELYGNPANKDKAIDAIKQENEISFSNRPGISDERELMGSGFDMKVVGRVKNELGGTDYIVQPRNIRPLKKEPNWQKPSETQLKQEFKVEHELKGNTYFGSEDEFMNAIKDAKVEEVTPEMDASISYRSRTDSKEQLVGMSKGYKSWPEFRNEGTIDEIYNGMKSGNKMDMPIVLEFPNGTRRVFSGNTRMDVAFQSGKNPKVLVVKVPDNGRALTSISGDASMQNAINNVDDIASGPTSNLSISDNFNDTQNFTKEILQLDDAQKRALLRDNPDKVVTKYKDIWDNQDDAFAETHGLFPQTRQGQQDAFDEGTAFAKKWMFKDSDKFDELNSAYKTGNEELMQLVMKRRPLESALSREMNAYIEPEIRQKAIAEFLKRDPNRQAFDIKNKNGYDPDFVKILVEQNPNDFQFQRLGNIQKQLESLNQKFGELQPDVYDNLRKINENVDPQFRDKVANIYAESLGENEMMPNMNLSQAEFHMGNIDDQSKLVQYGKFEPSYTDLSKSNKDYLDKNLFKIDGANLAGDSSIDGDIITLGSKPQLIGEQRFYKVMSNSGELASDPEYVRFVGSYMKSPYTVATTNVHEVAGHQGQKMFGNWINKLQEYDPEMLYEIPMDKNELAKLFKEVLVEPVKGVTLDEAGVAKNIRTNQTWQSSPQELYADLTIARYDMAKQMMHAYDVPMEMAIKMLKDPRNEDRYVEWFIQHPQVQQHFKPDATVDMKKQIIKYLPAVIIGAGYGMSQGMNSETPENKYGGNIKTLSKFIRK
jgi:hypothetical protein